MKKLLKNLALFMGPVLILIVVLLLWHRDRLAVLLETAEALTEGADWAERLKTPEDVLDYIAAHSEDVSLVAYRLDHKDQGIALNPRVRRPLASTIKILLLAGYAQQVEKGRLQPDQKVSVSAVEVYYLPGLDGGSHDHAIKEWKEQGLVNSDNQVPLRAVVRAMIRWSDNAATDFVIEQLERDFVEKLPALLGVPDQDAPLPISGCDLSWNNHTLTGSPEETRKQYFSLAPGEYGKTVYGLAHRLRSDAGFSAAERKRFEAGKYALGIKQQAAIVQALGERGTAEAYAEFMARVYAGTLLSPGVCKTMRDFLEWQMDNKVSTLILEAFGTKGGSLPGVVTAASFIKKRGVEPAMASAVFFDKMPLGVWKHMTDTFVQQRFEQKLLLNESFYRSVQAKLKLRSP